MQYSDKGSIFYIAIFMTGIMWIVSGCSQRPGIERSLEPHSPGYAIHRDSGYFFVRNMFGDIYAVPLSHQRLKEMLNNRPFVLSGRKSKKFRVPDFEFFHVLIHNTCKEPVYLRDPVLKYSGIEQYPVRHEYFKSKTRSPAYRQINTDALFAKRKLIHDPESPAEVDYKNETVETESEFIPPGKTLIIPLIFEWIPPEHRSLTLTFSLTAGDTTRPVECRFYRKEYRTKGNHFRDPEKQP